MVAASPGSSAGGGEVRRSQTLWRVGAGVAAAALGALAYTAFRWWKAHSIIREHREKFKGFWPGLIGTVTREKSDFRFCRWRDTEYDPREAYFETVEDMMQRPEMVRECFDRDREAGLLLDCQGKPVTDAQDILQLMVQEKRELVHSQKELFRFCKQSLFSGLFSLDAGEPLPGEDDSASMERQTNAMLKPPIWQLFKRSAFSTLKSISYLHSRLRQLQIILGEPFMEWRSGSTPGLFSSPIWEPQPIHPHSFLAVSGVRSSPSVRPSAPPM